MVHPEVIINRFRGKDHGQALGHGLQTVEGAIAADAYQSFDLQLLQFKVECRFAKLLFIL